MIRVFIITTAHPYNDGRVTHRIAKSFVNNGLEVSWFGPKPDGQIKLVEGIRFVFFDKGKSKIDRIIASFKLSQILKTQEPADIYFAVDPDSAIVANSYAKKHKSRSVFDIHEIFHRDMLYNHVPGPFVPLAGALIKALMKSVCRHANLIIGVGETRINPYKEISMRNMVVRHCVPANYASNNVALPFTSRSKDVKIMQGKISHEQGTLKLINAAKVATQITGLNIKIVVFNIFSKDLTKEFFNKYIKENDLEDYYTMLDPVPFNEMFAILSTCDIGAISYQRRMGVECMPNRVFEYMSVGIPIIVPSYSIEMMKILTDYNCGIGVDMENVDEIASGICTLVINTSQSIGLGRNGRKAFENDCNWEQESKKLIDWIIE